MIRGLPPTLAEPSRTLLMGVVNVTPDSFSDGGLWLEPDVAVAHGLALLEQGADLIDVGGESTRPGAGRVPIDEERRRVLPVIAALAGAGAVLSVDTTRAEVAAEALAAGAVIVNDVSGGLADPRMVNVVAEAGVPYVLMHWRGHSDRMQERARYDDVVADVRAELSARLEAVTAAGVDPAQVILDPGLGFAKRPEHSWAVLAHIDELATLGRPLLVGASRKGFVGQALAGPDGVPRPVLERDVASAALTVLAARAGVWAVRVHDVRASADALRMLAAWEQAR
jgi:dihydropteroate synthase